jgi:hypothetical protein
MMQTLQPDTDTLVSPPPNIRSSIQFYSIRVMPLASGFVAVDVQAWISSDDGQVDEMDLGGTRVQAREHLLEAIDRAVASPQFGRLQ